jgi:hypothetical protein
MYTTKHTTKRSTDKEITHQGCLSMSVAYSDLQWPRHQTAPPTITHSQGASVVWMGYICRGSVIPSAQANNVLDIPFSVTCMMRQWLRSMLLLSRQTLSAASSQAPGKTLDLLHHLACNHYKWRFRYFKPLFSFLLRPYSPHSSLVLL